MTRQVSNLKKRDVVGLKRTKESNKDVGIEGREEQARNKGGLCKQNDGDQCRADSGGVVG